MPSPSTSSERLFKKGIFVPIITPFKENEDLDLEALRRHVVRIGSAGAGIVVQGTTAEAIHMTPEERVSIILTARQALDDARLQHIPIIAGCGTGSLRETVTLTQDAAKAGADAAMIIAPSFFGGQLKSDIRALRDFWWTIADQSPLPVLIYNFPAVTGGIDLDSDLLEDLSQHPNIVGVKLTCGNIAKGNRLATSQSHAQHPNRKFLVLTGYSDIMFPSMLVGLQGSITGLGNLCPRLVVKLYNLTREAIDEKSWDKLEQARKLADIVARGDWASSKAGIGGNKWAIGHFYPDIGVSTRVRRPLFEASKETQTMLAKEFAESVKIERQLEQESNSLSNGKH
ncbi:unnamed protein product [Sympodiomycopsis kandeliae]